MKMDLPQTILLVEDEEDLRTLLKRVLEKTGYHVFSAGSVTEAKNLFSQHSKEINFLLSDIVLPDGRGDVLAEQLQALQSGLQVLLMSGYTEPKVLQRLKLHATFLPKPFHPRQLIQAIEKTFSATV